MNAADHAGPEPVVMTLGTGTVRWVYEAVMIGLALVVVYLLTLPDEGWVTTANLAIWGMFIADYAVRLALSTDRRGFVRRNIPDLIAISTGAVVRSAPRSSYAVVRGPCASS